MLAGARHASRAIVFLAALAAVGPCTGAHADIDLTGSWNVYFSNGVSQVWDITQNTSTFTVSIQGVTIVSEGFINPQTGSFFNLLYQQGPCQAVFFATASADGNAFQGGEGGTKASCSGIPATCVCVAVPGIDVRGCRIGTGADCCGDSVVGLTEQCDNGPEPATSCLCDSTCKIPASGAACDSDDNSCTNDVCDASHTCTHPPAVGKPCEGDSNACTTPDACDATGTCSHTPLPMGTPCSDGESCTADGCDGAGTCLHTPLAIGTPCYPDGDVCTTDTCNASGVCIHPLVDIDGDGVCDLFDPCVGGVVLTAARLRLGRVDTLAGNDQLLLKGDMQTPTGPPLDPIGNGLRLMLRGPSGVFLDVMLPPGAYSPTTHTGWKTRGTGFEFASPQAVGGAVNKARLKRFPSRPVVRLAISGRHGSYATGVPTPHDATVILSPSTGQCAEVVFQPTSCSTRAGTISCR